MLGLRSEPMQSNMTACSTGQSANHLHHRGVTLTLYIIILLLSNVMFLHFLCLSAVFHIVQYKSQTDL